MRKSWIAAVGVLALTLAACTGDTSATTTASQTQTTTSAEATTTTRPQITDGGLVPIDPTTLVPVPGAKSITQGDHFQGKVSPNGNWLALLKLVNNDQEWIEIVDLATKAVVAETRVPQGAFGLQITDDGTASWIAGDNRLTLFSLEAGANNREKVFDKFPETFFTDTFHLLGNDRFGFFGMISTDGQNQGEATIVIVDAGDDSMTQIALPNVDMGIIGKGEPVGDAETLEIANPVAVWHLENERVLVVEATRDVVTEVNLIDGEITEHPWRIPETGLDRLFAWMMPRAQAKGLTSGITRDAVLSLDGRHLYVATSVAEVEIEEDGEWTRLRTPQDLSVLDTETWNVSVIDMAVDALFLSSDGIHLLAQGSEVTESSNDFDVSPSPVYVVDTTSQELLIGFQTSDTSSADVAFSSDGAFVYITTWTETEMKIDVLDMGILQLTGAISFRGLSLIGPAGLMAFHLDE